MTYRNRRAQVYDAADIARRMHKTFTARDPAFVTELPFTWPRVLRHVGDSLAVAYNSDKWDEDWTLYKHVAESRNRCFVVPGFLREFDNPDRRRRTIGPLVSFEDVPMPKHVDTLALFEEANVKLHTGGTDMHPRFGPDNDDGMHTVVMKHGHLGGSVIRWSQVSKRRDEPFLFVYTLPRGSEPGGVWMLIVGDALDVRPEGIVG